MLTPILVSIRKGLTMKEKTCCFTGNRDIPINDLERMQKRLKEEIIKLIEQGYQFFGTGGALGFDTESAFAVLALKSEYPHIKLILVLPCRTQTNQWSSEDIAVYEEIKNRCDKFIYTSETYTKGCMFKRNRHLVDHSSVCIAYDRKGNGGTAYTVNYAKQKSIPIVNIEKKEY